MSHTNFNAGSFGLAASGGAATIAAALVAGASNYVAGQEQAAADADVYAQWCAALAQLKAIIQDRDDVIAALTTENLQLHASIDTALYHLTTLHAAMTANPDRPAD
jgi:hypothetical protein